MSYNVFEKQNNMERRNAQIVYLREVLQMGYNEISQIVGLAVSTCRNYRNKFIGLLSQAKEWFGEVTNKIVNTIKTKANIEQLVTFECEHKIGNCAYIIEYFDSQKNFTFLKVGMTNNIERRIKEHLRDYTKQGFDTTYAVVKKLFYAEDEEDALTLENLLRKHYKHKEHNGFIRRDRFKYLRFDNEELKNDIDLKNKLELFVV